MEYLFELSGEQPKLAKAEVKALIEAYQVEYKIREELTNLLIIKTNDKLEKSFFKRLGYTHSVLKHITSAKKLNDVLKDIENISSNKKFCVRAKRIKNNLKKISAKEAEERIGAIIKGPIDLENPKKVFKLFLTDQNLVFGEQIIKINRKEYRKRKPHKRPFFKPGAIKPELARACINLTRVRDGAILDVFSGTGSFLIEANDMDISSVGVDASLKMLKGSKKNQKLTKNKKNSLILADSRKTPFKPHSFEAIIADPPYGRSSTVYGDISDLYNQTIREALRNLKKGGYLCFISPKEGVDLKVDTNEIERYKVRVHRSLTRIIRVIRRRSSEL
ncbi:hypothetical protein C9439_01810 [archaeon SCG-AAA382B04]|nr:hypothetical protein C9439_01810 [archaeon SCG-AAA382B04]